MGISDSAKAYLTAVEKKRKLMLERGGQASADAYVNEQKKIGQQLNHEKIKKNFTNGETQATRLKLAESDRGYNGGGEPNNAPAFNAKPSDKNTSTNSGRLMADEKETAAVEENDAYLKSTASALSSNAKKYLAVKNGLTKPKVSSTLSSNNRGMGSARPSQVTGLPKNKSEKMK